MKRACRPTLNIRPLIYRSGLPNVERVRPSWTSTMLLPYSPMTYGWVTTRVLRHCLLEKWKFGAGRAWATNLVALTSVSGMFDPKFSNKDPVALVTHPLS